MSYFVSQVPQVVVKSRKMNYWSPRMKAIAVLLALLLYVYLLLVLKTIYSKTKRLDRIMAMAVDTEKQILNMHTIDQGLAVKMEHLEDILDDY